MAAAKSLRQAPRRAAAGERNADQRVRRELVIDARGDGAGAGREIGAADAVGIAVGVVAAAERRGPHVPALRRGAIGAL